VESRYIQTCLEFYNILDQIQGLVLDKLLKYRDSHMTQEEVVKIIDQSLKKAHTQAQIISLAENLDGDSFVDAEFAGFWPYDEDKIKSCFVKSRTGFGICTVTSPLVGASKLQSDIESSTM